MNKKGVELTMQTVVIALLVLLVLGVLIFLLFGGSTTFVKGTTCNPPGHCEDRATPCNEGETSGPWTCSNDRKCCIPVGT